MLPPFAPVGTKGVSECALKVVAATYEKWLLTRGSKESDLM